MDPIIFTIALIVLLIGTYTDLRTREIPDWVNYSFIFIALGLRGLYSLLYKDISFLTQGIAGFLVFLALALVLFYTGQWGGGDAKLLMGLGALIGLEFNRNAFLIAFFINTLVAGAIFAIAWALVLAIMKRKKFTKALKELLKKRWTIIAKRIVSALVIGLVILSLILDQINIKLALVSLALVTFIMFYIWLFVKAVENSCMLKLLPVSLLTEGDWIANNIVVKGKVIAGPKDLGISRSQIAKLKKLRIHKVLVKEGIPFTPAFLFGFLATVYWGNIFLLLL